MGAASNQKEEAAQRARKNRWAGFKGTGGTSRLRLIDQESLNGLIELVGMGGDALMFGRTSDGGIWCFTIITNDVEGKNYPKFYIKTEEDLDNFRTEIEQRYGD